MYVDESILLLRRVYILFLLFSFFSPFLLNSYVVVCGVKSGSDDNNTDANR